MAYINFIVNVGLETVLKLKGFVRIRDERREKNFQYFRNNETWIVFSGQTTEFCAKSLIKEAI